MRLNWFSILGLLLVPVLPCLAQQPEPPRYAGATPSGFLLPNGWTLSPAGEQLVLSDLPLNILPLTTSGEASPLGGRALVATSGYNAHELVLVDFAAHKVLDRQTVPQSWFGLAADAKSGRVWWSGGGSGLIHVFRIEGDRLVAGQPIEQPAPAVANDPKTGKPLKMLRPFRTGLCYDPQGQLLLSCVLPAEGKNQSLAWDTTPAANQQPPSTRGTLEWLAADSGKGERRASAGMRPYDVVVARNGLAYVSDWAGKCVHLFQPVDGRVLGKITVGEHPNQMALHPRDDRLFVACASSNCVSVIDTRRGVVEETIMTALFPLAPEGSTPDALAVAPDGLALYVANADNNCIAVVDISNRRRSQVQGFIPTGWYPTAVALGNSKTLLVAVGKGNETRPNPITAVPEKSEKGKPARKTYPYIGKTLSGALSIVPLPDERQLAAYTETVYRNCPYSDKLLSAAPYPHKTAIPTQVGDPSPIKHVIYIIKENRTYDQVLGDMPRGNGDPSLVMFGQQVTPNHHKLASEFVQLDNLYCNGHVSADGHPWSTMAYNTDYIARNWALTYSKRVGIEDDDDGDLANAPGGYLWDACARAGLSYRSYGEFGGRVSQPDGNVRMEGKVPGLVGHMSPRYGLPAAKGRSVRDSDRLAVFLEEFAEYEKNGDLPRFIVMSLGEDHTSGTTPGAFTPQACVASNDLALGRLVEAVSHSKYWPKMAIFVIEDDAQNGPDHVDAHRTVGLVISPYVRRKQLDSSQYSTVSMLRTIELILGLPPLSQFDAAARPMFAAFSDQPDLTPYKHEPARIDLEAKNSKLAYGAERSSRMDFAEYDKIDDFELNEILWRSIKGPDAPLPPAVRRAIAYRTEARPK
ncbi:MAG TPA: alkaline phosphatase family protein [Pirellulales bacterium]|jgi:YVTN family beta-propeller protein|nr:alkaline phosphatase family protein [Pirellulales bacterium]